MDAPKVSIVDNKEFRLERTKTLPSRALGLEVPRTRTHNSHIPLGYRTLSIHVYDSQRFDGPNPARRHHARTGPSLASRLAFWRRKSAEEEQQAPNALQAGADADFFSRLDHHTVSPAEVCQRFNVAPELGLDSSAATKRLQRNGKNVLAKRKSDWWKKALRYTFGDFCSILWIGVIIFFISWRPLGNPPAPYNLALAIVVLIVIFSQAIFSALQDWSAQKVMDSIMSLLPENAVVLRDGQPREIPSSDLVVGDVVLLSTGQKVPADMRIIKASNDLKFDRAVLTGESEEVAGTVTTDEQNFLEARNIALLGTHVCNGTATAVVVLTGASTVMGRINMLTRSGADERTTLQKEITRFVKIICGLTVTLVLIMLITWLAWLRVDHFDFLNTTGILTNLMSLVVAFIPEGMPIAVAMTLSLIARRMRDAKILPKSLSTVETLGCVNVICSDKTGTLTENKMSVVSLAYVDQQLDLEKSHLESRSFTHFRKSMIMCNDAFFDQATLDAPIAERKVQGNATDGALLRFAAALNGGLEAVSSNFDRAFDLPFNSKNKFALTYVIPAGEKVDLAQDGEILVKGAPDILLDRCDSYVSGLEDGEVKPLDADARARLVAQQEALSRQGQRVIILTRRSFVPANAPGTTEFEAEVLEAAASSLTVIGLVGIIDPPRVDIPHTVSEARRCGIRFTMVTGDFSLTACAIAQQIGILRRSDPDRIADFTSKDRYAQLEKVRDDRLAFIDGALVVEGKEIAALSQQEWDVVCKYEEIVFARTTPEQKLRIVTEFRARGNVVAVSGDGVNDAPALKAANVGIAMASGSEVAMEAADLVLMGDFSNIIEGVRLGRLVFQNLQKVISYLLPAGSYSEDWPVIFNVFFGCPLPLSSFLMIIICCFTDLFCCLMLVFEKPEFDLLSLPPRDPSKSRLVNLRVYGHSYLFIGTLETLCAHSMFFFYIWTAAGIPVNRMFFAFEKYSDGFYGHTQAELNHFLNTGQCVYFVTLVILQFANLNSVRNKRMSIFQNGPQHNWKLICGPVISLAIAIFVTEVKGIQNLFGTASVPIKHWLLPIPLAIGVLAMDEVRKVLVRAWPKGLVAKLSW
ncbi:hypothetical protein RTG_02055 [Rhodotorula toruloides ATCC 204091]|uniref:Cation-transporting P-type ATPase N-terminal domain-containing protein n=1 Tax=Rhodotorula toruloides TaxID=5286 RepID=A0A0K3CBM8_RHOTO|nr:hypothetical protein RTG_02055 [Rhodotorula toruloides ATCC 204091]PRQ76027.1 hypothetical protein AAT19DRAFT_13049 [Rhodotorula toruloides]